MAEYLSMQALRSCCRASVAGGLALWASVAVAQGLQDPTRPPAVMSSDSQTAAASGPILQSVLISQQRVEAIINGHTVRVGDRVGEARVLRITANEVMLRNEAGVQTLKIFPDIQKHQNSGRAATGPDRRR